MVKENTRTRILEAGAELFRRQGYAGTGMKAIATAANAPFGSIYHFFPGGKEEMSAEVIRTSGAAYGALIPLYLDDAENLVDAVRESFAGAADTLVASDFADACPIATVALEVASINEPLRRATADVFQSWLTALSSRFERHGISPAAADKIAIAFLAALEGGFLLARAFRDASFVRSAGDPVVEAIRVAISTQGDKS